MKHGNISQLFSIRLVLVSLLVLAWLALAPQTVLAEDGFAPVEGVCLTGYDSPINCTAQDVRIEEIIDFTVLNGCSDQPLEGMPYDMMTVSFTVMVSAEPTPPRYDIGIFMAKYGNDAAGDGVCYQDYLAPALVDNPVYLYTILPGETVGDVIPDIYEKYPYDEAYFTGWWDGDGDACGDMERATQVFMTDIVVEVACYDSAEDADSQVEISMCVAWNEQAKQDCYTYADAGPATPAKCSCETINFPFTPTALEQMSLEARNKTDTTTYLLLGGVGLLLAVGTLGSFVLYRKARVISR